MKAVIIVMNNIYIRKNIFDFLSNIICCQCKQNSILFIKFKDSNICYTCLRSNYNLN